jgi:hypothetical protein
MTESIAKPLKAKTKVKGLRMSLVDEQRLQEVAEDWCCTESAVIRRLVNGEWRRLQARRRRRGE